MLETSARLLRLLSLFQGRRYWPGADLAGRLEVTSRTLRRDVDRLRGLGYTVAADSGPGGGYQLGQGRDLPPLLLDDDEAVAIAVSLRSAADSFAGLGDTAVRALVKLEQLLPVRLRRRVGALQAVTLSVDHSALPLDIDLLMTLATACRDRLRVTLHYRDRGGRDTTRTVEPLQLAHTATRRWYLVAWDLSRSDWRTLRVDRIAEPPQIGEPFVPRPPPPDVARYVSDALTKMPGKLRAQFKLAESATTVLQRMPDWIGWVTPIDVDHCLFIAGGDTFDELIGRVLLAGAPFEVLEPPELRAYLPELAERLRGTAR